MDCIASICADFGETSIGLSIQEEGLGGGYSAFVLFFYFEYVVAIIMLAA